MRCEEFKKLMNGYGIEDKEIREAIEKLKIIYISGGEVLKEIGTGGQMSEQVFSVPAILENKQFDLFEQGAHGYGKLSNGRYYFSILTEKGIELAKDCLRSEIDLYREDIENIVKRYSKKFLYILSYVTQTSSGLGGLEYLELRLPDYEVGRMNLSENLETLISSQIHSFLIAEDSDLSENYWNIRNSKGGVIGHINSRQRENIGNIPIYIWDAGFSEFLLKNNEPLHETALQFFEEMEEMGFAKLSDSHNSGKYTGQVYRMPEEILEFISPMSSRPEEEFKVLSTFWLISIAREKQSKEEFLNYVYKLNIGEDEIARYIEGLNLEFPGLTTAYSYNSGDFMPFLVRGDVNASLAEWLKRISSTILSDSGGIKNVL